MWACCCGTRPLSLNPTLSPRSFSISASLRRHLRPPRRRHLPPHPSPQHLPTTTLNPHQNLNLVIDVHTPLRHLTDAVDDLRTLVSVDADRRLVVSCRRPTLVLLGNLTLALVILVVVFKALVKLGLGLNSRNRDSREMVYRRDRSLGGKQVLVGRKVDLLPSPSSRVGKEDLEKKVLWRRKEGRRLPGWWPVSLPPPVVSGGKEGYQKMADRLIRAILDQRILGNDISEHDIVEFRRLCRGCGVSVYIETSNARDTFYRASVDFVMKVCDSVDFHSSSVNIDGEDARQFIAGIAGNIGVDHFHAAKIVTAAVAARTRSCFLQAWALEMQGKHSEAAVELSKICLLHRIFPPEENSPEMEMVARGLEKNLKLEDRKFLMSMLAGICTDGNHTSVAEALGLLYIKLDALQNVQIDHYPRHRVKFSVFVI